MKWNVDYVQKKELLTSHYILVKEHVQVIIYVIFFVMTNKALGIVFALVKYISIPLFVVY